MKMADVFIHAKKKLIFLKCKSQKLYAKMHLNKRISLLRYNHGIWQVSAIFSQKTHLGPQHTNLFFFGHQVAKFHHPKKIIIN